MVQEYLQAGMRFPSPKQQHQIHWRLMYSYCYTVQNYLPIRLAQVTETASFSLHDYARHIIGFFMDESFSPSVAAILRTKHTINSKYAQKHESYKSRCQQLATTVQPSNESVPPVASGNIHTAAQSYLKNSYNPRFWTTCDFWQSLWK